MELSLLCEVKLLLCVVDKTEKMMVYSTEKNPNNFISNYLVGNNIPASDKEYLSNSDYKEIFIDNTKPDSRFNGEQNVGNCNSGGNSEGGVKSKAKSEESDENKEKHNERPLSKAKQKYLQKDDDQVEVMSVKENSFFSLPSLSEQGNFFCYFSLKLYFY